MRTLLLLMTFLGLAACGFSRHAETLPDQNHNRHIASEGVKQLLATDAPTFSELLQEKLTSLHAYYLIGRKNLLRFDADLADVPLKKLYRSDSYLKLIAVRSQTIDIENDLHEAWEAMEKEGQRNVRRKIEEAAAQSGLWGLSMANLSRRLRIKIKTQAPGSVDAGIRKLNAREFAVYEKNIEHLAHLLDIDLKNGKKGKLLKGNDVDALDWMPQEPQRLKNRTRALSKVGVGKSRIN